MEYQRKLTERLALTGAGEHSGSIFPLSGADAARVFSAAADLAGTDYPEYVWNQLRGRLPDWWNNLLGYPPDWDGSYDGLVAELVAEYLYNGSCDFDEMLCLGEMLYQVLAAPFLLIQRAWETEEKYSGRIREIREENKKLREALS